MFQKTQDSLSLWYFENLFRFKEILHFISARPGGSSLPPYDSLNLALHVGDDIGRVGRNRERLARTLGLLPEDFIFVEQVHGGDVAVIRRENIPRKSVTRAADALITNIEGLCLMVLVADCVPILFYDPQREIIGMAHAGWRGTVQKIARNTVNAMVREYACRPRSILAALGPAIGPCCYEIKSGVVKEIQSNLVPGGEIVINRNNKYYFDLKEANRKQLLDAGLTGENIEIAKACTRCNKNVFFSSRSSQGPTGRFAAGIMLKKSIRPTSR